MHTFGSPLLRSPFYSLLSSRIIRLTPLAFEKLIVYQKAITFADAACSLTKDLPCGYFSLANQLNRAALSIAANIAEGNECFTLPDRKGFCSDAVSMSHPSRTLILSELGAASMPDIRLV